MKIKPPKYKAGTENDGFRRIMCNDTPATPATPHTPAPWHVSRHATPDYAPQFGIYAGDGNGRGIAIVTSNEANANLIAAAPAMLAACTMLLTPGNGCYIKAVAMARAAIANAKGTP